MRCAWRARKCGCGTTKPPRSWDIQPGQPWKRSRALRIGFRRTVIVRTWLLVAAEGREFDGIRRRMGRTAKIEWHGAKFACEAAWRGDRWWMVANGPGSRLVDQMLDRKTDVNGIISTGL